MAKLRMTLPKEFRDFYNTRKYIWTEEDITQCRELLAACDPDARDRGGYKETALHYYVPYEIAEWLVERGADVNAANTYGTPIFKHARVGDYDICRLLIEHGADVNIEDYAGMTALFDAADGGHCDIITLLLEHGADPCHHSRNFADGLTPLLYMLRHISYVPQKKYADVAELLVKAQRERDGISDEDWRKAQEFVASIGHEFELIKSEKKDNYSSENESAMSRLYRLFDVAPAAPVIRHDGSSPIIVDENLSTDEQHQALWEFLVPASGKCMTVQGEVIRITGRVDHESNGNAGANWDAEYRKMLKALIGFFGQGNALEEEVKAAQEAVNVINGCRACGCGKEIDMLEKFAIEWVRRNPVPIPLGDVNYRR